LVEEKRREEKRREEKIREKKSVLDTSDCSNCMMKS
jgi:hypothetical protein